MANYPTPHINAKPEDFGKTVLMPGDPLRSKFMAESFLKNAELINNVRGVQGYTGSYNGEKITVMASGMGMPSIGIYSYELFNFFGVEQILRVGSAGALRPDLNLRDVVLGQAACTNSAFGAQYHLRGNYAPIADFSLLQKCVREADAMGLSYHVGNLLSSDTFYDAGDGDTMAWGKMGVLAVEMEAAALYMNAAQAGKRALAICTISDSLCTGEATTAEQRQSSFTDMMELALRTAMAK